MASTVFLKLYVMHSARACCVWSAIARGSCEYFPEIKCLSCSVAQCRASSSLRFSSRRWFHTTSKNNRRFRNRNRSLFCRPLLLRRSANRSPRPGSLLTNLKLRQLRNSRFASAALQADSNAKRSRREGLPARPLSVRGRKPLHHPKRKDRFPETANSASDTSDAE